jgi:hypothetical protein
MTAAATTACHPPGPPALMSATTHTPNPPPESDPNPKSFSVSHIVCRAASASRPCGRYAVGLRPSPDPDAYLSTPTPRRRNPKQKQFRGLTGPAPSGMTCKNDWFSFLGVKGSQVQILSSRQKVKGPLARGGPGQRASPLSGVIRRVGHDLELRTASPMRGQRVVRGSRLRTAIRYCGWRSWGGCMVLGQP